jgi:hypothetical protein
VARHAVSALGQYPLCPPCPPFVGAEAGAEPELEPVLELLSYLAASVLICPMFSYAPIPSRHVAIQTFLAQT